MITTLAELKSYLGITDTTQDVLLTILNNASNQIIETYISRKINEDTYTEYIDGNAQSEIIIQNYPITELISVKRNIGTMETPNFENIGGYSVDKDKGILRFMFYLARGFKNYEVKYKGGYATVPGDLKLASLKLSAKYYNTKESDGIKAESNNGDRLEFDVAQIPNDILIILNSYRDMDV